MAARQTNEPSTCSQQLGLLESAEIVQSAHALRAGAAAVPAHEALLPGAATSQPNLATARLSQPQCGCTPQPHRMDLEAKPQEERNPKRFEVLCPQPPESGAQRLLKCQQARQERMSRSKAGSLDRGGKRKRLRVSPTVAAYCARTRNPDRHIGQC